MARSVSLREFQQGLAQRLRDAQAEAEPTSRLGVEAGEHRWLVKLDDTGEILPIPEISAVPLTRPWYLGLANIRGVLASVVDFSAFAGGAPTARTPEGRLLLLAERFRVFSGLLISRLLGLRNVRNLSPTGATPPWPWASAVYRDGDGAIWHELDVAALVKHGDFLNAGV